MRTLITLIQYILPDNEQCNSEKNATTMQSPIFRSFFLTPPRFWLHMSWSTKMSTSSFNFP